MPAITLRYVTCEFLLSVKLLRLTSFALSSHICTSQESVRVVYFERCVYEVLSLMCSLYQFFKNRGADNVRVRVLRASFDDRLSGTW